jgi:acetyltransferase-like isoleucine patch superfamily enzyme
MSNESYCEIGDFAQIDPDVILGYRYPGDSQPAKIGDYAIIRSGSIIYADTTIGRHFSCGHQVLIRAEVVAGDRVVVHHKCTLEGRIQIGNGVKIMAHVYIPSRTEIGDMVFIGPGVTFLNDRYPMRSHHPVVGATIEDHVTIGGGAVICPGVRIGQRAFIGAGALVNKDVPPETLALGVPARHYPIPDGLSAGNLPELMLPQTDLWGAQSDESWRDDAFWKGDGLSDREL